METQRRRHCPEGEGEAASGATSIKSGNSSSGSAMPASDPPRLEQPPLEKRGLELETEMTDAPVEQQGVPKRRKEHPTVPESVDGNSKSSSSCESSTDTEMGLVDVCTIPLTIPRQKTCTPVVLDLTKWDFSKADCRTRCRK